MAIAKGYKANFETMKRAFAAGDVALMDCTDIVTGKPVIVVCATQREEGGDITFVPLAKMFDGNPYEEVLPAGHPDGKQLRKGAK